MKRNEYTGYDVIKSDEWLILLERGFWSAQEDPVEVFLKQSTGDIVYFCGLNSAFVSDEVKGVMLLIIRSK